MFCVCLRFASGMHVFLSPALFSPPPQPSSVQAFNTSHALLVCFLSTERSKLILIVALQMDTLLYMSQDIVNQKGKFGVQHFEQHIFFKTFFFRFCGEK